MVPEILTVSYHGMEPFTARPLKIGAFCDKNPALPVSMQPKEAESSRLLDALEKKQAQSMQRRADAISFGSYRKDGGDLYRSFFEMERMPFVRDVPIQELYESPAMSEAL